MSPPQDAGAPAKPSPEEIAARVDLARELLVAGARKCVVKRMIRQRFGADISASKIERYLEKARDTFAQALATDLERNRHRIARACERASGPLGTSLRFWLDIATTSRTALIRLKAAAYLYLRVGLPWPSGAGPSALAPSTSAAEDDPVAAAVRAADVDAAVAKLIELRFFGGLTGDETATALGVSAATADRVWRFTRAWLQVELQK
jgi:ECF sigma factor